MTFEIKQRNRMLLLENIFTNSIIKYRIIVCDTCFDRNSKLRIAEILMMIIYSMLRFTDLNWEKVKVSYQFPVTQDSVYCLLFPQHYRGMVSL